MYLTLLFILALASVAVFAVPKKFKMWAALALVCGGAWVSVSEAVRCLAGKAPAGVLGTGSMLFGGEQAGVDTLSALFIVIASVAAVSATLYSRGYVGHYADGMTGVQLSLHYVSLVLLYLSIIGVVSFRSAFGFLFSWELMTLCSFMLMLFHGDREKVRKAAMNYLVLMHIGFVCLLSGFVTIGESGLGASFDSMAAYFSVHDPVPLFILFLVGFGMKAGIFPLHVWVPEADPAAPAHVSALMSGVMSKMGVYGVIRMMTCLDGNHLTIGVILFAAGAVTALWGAVLAAAQNDMRRLLAYSGIENIGIIFMALGLSLLGGVYAGGMLAVCAMAGALMHALNHSLMKTLLFFGSGNVYTQTGTASLDELGGVAGRMPATAIITLVGVAAICALPPLNGFVSEFLIYFGLMDNISTGAHGVLLSICGVVILSLTGGVVLLAFCKYYGVASLGSPRSPAVGSAVEVDAFRIVASALPLALMILVGVLPGLFVEPVFALAGRTAGMDASDVYAQQVAPPLAGISLAAAMLAGIGLLAAAVRWALLRRREVSWSPTWRCGFTAPGSAAQYTGESFSDGLKGVAVPLTGSRDEGKAVDKDEIFPSPHGFSVRREDRVDSFMSRRWVEIIHVINSRVMKMRTGKVNNYVLYALLFLVLVFVLTALDVI